MRYPKFLKDNDTIGITAMSAGVGNSIEDFEKSLKNIKSYGFNVIETDNVRVSRYVSSSGEERANQLNDLVNNKKVNMIMCACGGDFGIEMMPHINDYSIKKNIKWYSGASDPTSFLYYVTTKFDIATLYGFNAGSFDNDELHESQKNFLNIVKGNIPIQNSYDLYESDKSKRSISYALDTKVEWKSNYENVCFSGRLIGGCIDVLREMIGTKYDYTKKFLDRYKDEGIVWYFDNFALGKEDFYRTLFQMRNCGWFDNTVGVIVGRVMYPSGFIDDLEYEDGLKKIFGDIPYIYDADVGHVCPKMTMINGSEVVVKYKDNKGSIEFNLE